MTPLLLAVVVLALPVCFGVAFALTHDRAEVDAYLARSRAITSVMLPLAVLLLAVGVIGLAVADAL